MLAVSRGRILCLAPRSAGVASSTKSGSMAVTLGNASACSADDCPRTPGFMSANSNRSASWVAQEYLCSFESLEGLVYRI